MSLTRTRAWAATVLLALATGATGAAAAAPPAAADIGVQALPSPLAFVSSLDLECFRTDPYVPPPITIQTRHINPVLGNLPVETHTLGAREKLCVPVAKNNMFPPAGVIEFVRFVDLSCYRITGATVNFPLTLRHLNPLFATVAPKNVVLLNPQHLCVPVIKNGVMPPPEVFNLVRFIDLKCYLEMPQTAFGPTIQLTHLNPVLGNLPPHVATITLNRQLCVPVIKNGLMPPADVFNVVRWVDLEMYDIQTAPPPAALTLQLVHINPVLGNLPPENAILQQGFQLGLPVSKNGLVPPA
jgi:hypothetical protein